MSKYIGYFVVHPKTRHMLEGPNKSARVFDSEKKAYFAIQGATGNQLGTLTYDVLVKSLLGGASFSFEEEATHARFMSRLRNDMAHRSFQAASQDRTFVQWVKEEKSAVPAAPAAPPTESGQTAFNPSILAARR